MNPTFQIGLSLKPTKAQLRIRLPHRTEKGGSKIEAIYYLISKGKLTKVTSAVSTTEYMSFDILGRVTRSKQTTDGVEYGGGNDPLRWMTYGYNLSGAMVEQQYPSGRVVKNTLDADGDLAAVESKKTANDLYRPYANSFVYTAAGDTKSCQSQIW